MPHFIKPMPSFAPMGEKQTPKTKELEKHPGGKDILPQIGENQTDDSFSKIAIRF